MSSTASRPYDIVIWGATGFTGKLVTRYMQQHAGNTQWAVAGRNRSKLDALDIGDDVGVIVADSHDRASLDALVSQTKVVLTTVGPYAKYGNELVAACAEHGTHYCDLTGEVHWMRQMIDAHADAARASGAKIVHTCGFDSIPSDLGVYFLQRAMQEQHGVAARQVKYRANAFKGGFSGGTIDSMMTMMESAQTDDSIMQVVNDPYALNNQQRGLDGPDHTAPFLDADFNQWVGPFVMAQINTRVVRRSNELLDFQYGHDFRYDEGTLTGAGVTGMFGATALSLGTNSMNTFAGFGPTRRMMQNFLPKPGEGPTESQIENGFFEILLHAKHPSDDSKDLRAKVRGDKDPGYGSTAKMLAQSALCLAQDELSVGGGFWTPASAMGDALLARLPDQAGVTFELVGH